MSPKQLRRASSKRHVRVLSALGDETRLSLVTRLADGQARSITELADDYDLTRQAITKHLRILENAGVVCSVRTGRENLFRFDGKPLHDLQDYLNAVSEQWDEALARLKAFVED